VYGAFNEPDYSFSLKRGQVGFERISTTKDANSSNENGSSAEARFYPLSDLVEHMLTVTGGAVEMMLKRLQQLQSGDSGTRQVNCMSSNPT